jgi:translation initiation factor 1
MLMKESSSNLVYTSDAGRICPTCSKPVAICICRRTVSHESKGDGVVRVGRETKGRKGKGVTVISGVSLPQDELKKLTSELKHKCGSGGTLKNGVIEIQGDHREGLIAVLKAKGWTVKKSGG